MSVTSGQAAGYAGRLSCRRVASIRCPPSRAMSSGPGPDPRPACRPPRASTGTLTRCCLPTRQENLLPAGLLCTTMWITCVKRRRACAHPGKCWGSRGPGRAYDRAFTWGERDPHPANGEKPELSTRHAAIAHK